jgi:Mitochondrial calcium uniporter
VSVELSSSVPPRLFLDILDTQKEFKLESNKSVSEWFKEIRQEYLIKDPIKVLVSDKIVPESTLLGDITKKEFTLVIGNSPVYVLPGLALFIRGNEKYYAKCYELGVPFNEARLISKFLEVLESQLPAEFTSQELDSALKRVKSLGSSFKEEEVSILKSQLASFEQTLHPLESKLESIKSKSEKHASLVINIGLGVMAAQWAGIAYGTYVLYGWDTMEPLTYMIGSTWALLGFSFFFQQKQEFYFDSFRQSLYTRKFNKLVQKNQISLDRIKLLKKNIEMVQNEISKLKN